MADFNSIARKWQAKWDKSKIFKVKENPKKQKCYVLEMYPYPSSTGLHMGHARNYCIGDAYARYKRMQGFNVLYPMGYDSFGLPAENAAIQAKSHPKIFTEIAISNFIRQQKELGLSYDWSRVLMSHDPAYYRWDQWIFLKMYEKGLTYKRKAVVNWCPKCNTVLANEQVHNGKCWRHTDTDVDVKELEQWFFKITDYAGEMLDNIDKLNWSEDVKMMQRNWIGKSEGALINFKIKDSGKSLTVFTTRPDTFFGITFLVYAPEHPDVMELVKGTKYEQKVKEFIRKVVIEDRFTRTAENKEKEGLFIGKYAINPLTKEKIPIYIANFVLYEYGTGAIIAVPAHDQRDFEFAKKYGIPIKVVINPPDYSLNPESMSRAYAGDGIMVNSFEFNGTNNREAIPKFIRFFEKNKCGKGTTQYKLRDWLISRQRFWGCPIPIIYCDKCGIIPVPEKDLPVMLPKNARFDVEGNPLAHCNDFVNTKCPKCNSNAKRETDTMDTFVDSSWYFLRYCDPTNNKHIFSKKKTDYWMPIDLYIGGKEHATMHLIYLRFFTKFLRDIGLISIDEPAPRLFNQGMLHKGGSVMSKSKGNVVIPEETAEKYGIDTARLFLLFIASPDKDMEWSDESIEGCFRFLNRFYSIISSSNLSEFSDAKEEARLNKTVKDVTAYLESLSYNKAIIEVMQTTNWLSERNTISKKCAETLTLLMSPFTPHICEELYEFLGYNTFCSLAKWPDFDESKIDNKLLAAEGVIEKTIFDIRNVLRLTGIQKLSEIKLIVSSKWKYRFIDVVKSELRNTRDAKQIISICVADKELKQYGSQISKIVPLMLKDASKIPEENLNQDIEYSSLSDSVEVISKEFECKVIVEKAEESREEKAKHAMPSKPAIVVKK